MKRFTLQLIGALIWLGVMSFGSAHVLAEVSTDDPYRPMFHFTAKRGWINDPNGLFFFAGQWHLGYQAEWPRKWGHAVSTDLFQWRELPFMLSPDEQGDMWSGSAVVDWNNTSGLFAKTPGIVAAFTSWGPPNKSKKTQTVGLAFSSDAGKTWTKFAGNPVLADPAQEDFRDPKIFWHQQSGAWIGIVTIGSAMRIYSSHDLLHWKYESIFGAGLIGKDVEWECPDLFPLTMGAGKNRTTAWVLTASAVSQKNFTKPPVFSQSNERYFVGTFDGHTFVPDPSSVMPRSASFGDTYATVSWSDVPASDGRRIAIGWMNHWGYADKLPTKPWQGALSLPREMRLTRADDKLRLIQTPAHELQRWRHSRIRPRDLSLRDGHNPLAGTNAETAEIIADFDVGSAEEVGLRVRMGDGHETLIGYDPAKQQLFIDRSRSGLSNFHEAFKQPLVAPLSLKKPGRLQLQVVLDRSSIEVFADDGAVYLAAVIFANKEHVAMAVYGRGKGARLRALEVNVLGPPRN